MTIESANNQYQAGFTFREKFEDDLSEGFIKLANALFKSRFPEIDVELADEENNELVALADKISERIFGKLSVKVLYGKM